MIFDFVLHTGTEMRFPASAAHLAEHFKQRVIFGQALSERQVIRSWIVEVAIGIRSCRLLALEIGWGSIRATASDPSCK